MQHGRITVLRLFVGDGNFIDTEILTQMKHNDGSVFINDRSIYHGPLAYYKHEDEVKRTKQNLQKAVDADHNLRWEVAEDRYY